jgi:hypothetical protein
MRAPPLLKKPVQVSPPIAIAIAIATNRQSPIANRMSMSMSDVDVVMS